MRVSIGFLIEGFNRVSAKNQLEIMLAKGKFASLFGVTLPSLIARRTLYNILYLFLEY